MKTYLSAYFGSLLLSLVLTPAVIALALRYELFDRTSPRKVHSGRIARIGGAAIYISMMILIAAVYLLPNKIGDDFRQLGIKIIAMLFGATLLFVIGLIDDIRPVKTWIKFLSQISAAVFVCLFGIRIEIINVPDLFSLNFGIFSWPFTILWIVGVTNAVNFIDGLDGLAAGICAIACGTIAALAIYFGQAVLCVIMLALAGGLTGFLFFNFNPAKIFMGDCGSLFLGFIIASAAVMCTAKSQTLVAFALPLLSLGIPIFDTLFIMVNRLGQNKPVYVPDTEHFHHRLLRLGLKQRHVAVLAYAVTLLATGAGVFILAARSVKSIMIFVSILVLIILIFHVIGAIGVKQIMDALRRKYD
ncbi:MAG: undecaprenyl/decaprenyl-phosphate alpha-N-acetylglucosaminyl 1-phosphate transferase [Sedimentisphaerales bacterium]|nr:undecaprenyl/decaprenyl-phosphate alpha-N-acetylglucosaminyl 1-phosphate transferase [Sedimentisphaerales bacterium]